MQQKYKDENHNLTIIVAYIPHYIGFCSRKMDKEKLGARVGGAIQCLKFSSTLCLNWLLITVLTRGLDQPV